MMSTMRMNSTIPKEQVRKDHESTYMQKVDYIQLSRRCPVEQMMARIAYSARLLFASALILFSTLAATAPLDGPSLPILVYHQIRADANGPANGPTAISLNRFEAQMRYLKEHGYTTLSTNEGVEFVARRTAFQPKKIVAIHFNDGWKSAQLTLPVLNRYGFKRRSGSSRGKAVAGHPWTGRKSS